MSATVVFLRHPGDTLRRGDRYFTRAQCVGGRVSGVWLGSCGWSGRLVRECGSSVCPTCPRCGRLTEALR